MSEPFEWDNDALDDLEKFEELVRLGQSLDGSNNILKNLARVIELAEALDRTDYLARRVSFRSRLRQSADAVLMERAASATKKAGDTTGAKR